MQKSSYRYNLYVSWIIILCFIHTTLSQAQSIPLIAKNLNCYSYITISGQSNINQFELSWSDLGIKSINNENEYGIDTSFYRIAVPVKDFKVGNSFMYKDFIELMKAKDFPSIIIRIPQNQLEKIKQGEYFYNMKIMLTIAGVSKLYEVPCYVVNCTEKALYLNGEKKIHFTDFDMIPPVKLQGLVKVRDEIRVDFGFILTFENSFENIVSL